MQWHDEPNWFDRLRWWSGWYRSTWAPWVKYLMWAIVIVIISRSIGCGG